jgi:hypothetical protein
MIPLGPRRCLRLASLTLAACSSTPAAPPGIDGSIDHTSTIVGTDSGSVVDAANGGSDAAALSTTLRVALVSPLGYGVDICLRANGSATFYNNGVPLLDLPTFGDAGTDSGKRKLDAGDAAADATRRRDAGDAARDATKQHDAAMDAPTRREAATDATRRHDAGDARADVGHDAHGRTDAHDAERPNDAQGEALAREGGGRDANRDAVEDARHDATRDAAHGGSMDAHRGAAEASRPDAGAKPDAGEKAGGVLYGHVSQYKTVALAGTVEVTLVRGGSTVCSATGEAGAALVLGTQRITLEPGRLSTLVVRNVPALVDGGGSFDAAVVPLGIVVLTDEPAAVPSSARARFFNATTASDGGEARPLRISAIGSTSTGPLNVPLAREVPVDQASLENPADPPVDSLGYWAAPAPASLTPIELMVTAEGDAGSRGHRHGAASAVFGAAGSSLDSLELTNGTNHTGFVLGPVGSETLVWCEDSIASEAGVVVFPSSPCTTLMPQ